ncbi:bifunctional 4-hydroxy-2-oxoglutarate aldolase/2-dehydro-3-deoxy-phosphogluconate aldolase [Microbacterium aurantiacum]|uniref:2-dehydro-3-deoxy-phosphogluconate aldolase n=2 Tax=Microbacterium aurantiacum TaxID=162393 RepID=A0ABT8FSS8_9MICO|nr:bifunctional 4-hydroxy-2-oxoglutarate aldolase/2-dehydro-3-deoxy-phosphogluconate aldolase [Microbacterium aurantiacum]
MMLSPVFADLARHRVVPVVTARTAEEGLRIADALAEGGLPVAEITFRTAAAADAIAAVAREGGVLVGAGTVLRADQVDEAVDAGARFVVSPGTSAEVIERCRHHGIPVLPGAVTATEVQTALALGVGAVKFFPAATSGGIPALRALGAPFSGLGFVPTGGIDEATAPEYLAVPSVLAVGGSWMLPADAIDAGDWDRITDLTRRAVTRTRSPEDTPLR